MSKTDIAALITFAIVLFAIAPGVTYIKIRAEQRTFNRCTQSNVSFWEAAFTELRVEGCKP